MKKGFAILLACSLLLQSGCGGAEREAPGAAGGGASASAAREEAPLLAEVLGVPEHYAYEEAYVPPDIGHRQFSGSRRRLRCVHRRREERRRHRPRRRLLTRSPFFLLSFRRKADTIKAA